MGWGAFKLPAIWSLVKGPLAGAMFMGGRVNKQQNTIVDMWWFPPLVQPGFAQNDLNSPGDPPNKIVHVIFEHSQNAFLATSRLTEQKHGSCGSKVGT